MRKSVLAVLVAAPFVIGAATTASADDAAPALDPVTLTDSRIVESSGLVVLGGGLAVTMNDSGGDAEVFTVDLSTGRTVGTTTWDGDAHDLEALAPASATEVWVGDIGDNGRTRDDVEVTRVPVGRGDRSVAGETFHLTYPDRAQDAEALLSDPATGRLYVVTKNTLGGGIYAAPERLSARKDNVMTKVAAAPPMVTDAAFFPDGKHVLLRDYFRASVLSFPEFDTLATVTLPVQRQGEGLGIGADGRIFLSSEGRDQPLVRIDLPTSAREALATPPGASRGSSATASASAAPAPGPTAPDSSSGSGSGGSGSGAWVPALFGVLGLLLLGGIVKLLRG